MTAHNHQRGSFRHCLACLPVCLFGVMASCTAPGETLFRQTAAEECNEIKAPLGELYPQEEEYFIAMEAVRRLHDEVSEPALREQFRRHMAELPESLALKRKEWADFIAKCGPGTKLFRVKQADCLYYVIVERGRIREKYIIYKPLSPMVL